MRLAAVVAVWSVGACADCFLEIEGRVIECGTSTALPDVSMTIHIDANGIDDPRTLPYTFVTDASGTFDAHTYGTEFCDAWATLTFRKEGFMTLDQQFKGSTKSPAEVCLVRMTR